MADIAFIATGSFTDSHIQEHLFLTEQNNKRLTIIQIVIIVYNSKWRKIKKFDRAFDQLGQFLTSLKLKIYIYHTKRFIHSYLLYFFQPLPPFGTGGGGVQIMFQQVFFHTKNLVFRIFKSLLWFKSLAVIAVEVYKFHVLIEIKNTLQWNYNVMLQNYNVIVSNYWNKFYWHFWAKWILM